MSACVMRLDALDVDLVERHARAERQAGQQGELVRRVEAADVEGRIGLGVALGLRFREHVGELALVLLHLGQDVVAGAVQDAVDAAHLVGRQRLAQRLDDRDGAGDRRLEVEGNAALLGELGQLGAVVGQQRLVGGHDVLAGLQRGFDGLPGGALLAADQLDEHIDRRIDGQSLGLVEPLDVLERDAALLGAAARGDALDLDAPAERLRQPRRRAPAAGSTVRRPPCRARRRPISAAGSWDASVMPFVEWGSRYASFPGPARGTS